MRLRPTVSSSSFGSMRCAGWSTCQSWRAPKESRWACGRLAGAALDRRLAFNVKPPLKKGQCFAALAPSHSVNSDLEPLQ